MTQTTPEERKLVSEITQNRKSGKVAIATLHTDDRVLARITDGIYRQPASALRELISNAYDADAANVIIHTDAPRFNQITIRDDGNGMDIAALARLIHHIGGSIKRRTEGAAFGLTSKRDPTLSPKGRRLIGKIGIGLFSVSQLTRHFQIVTKVKGKDYRLVAEVILRTYTEDELARSVGGSQSPDKIKTGTVRIVSVPAEDSATHGTEVILMDLRPQAKALLQSKETWDLVGDGSLDAQGIMPHVRVPSFHVGQADATSDRVTRTPKLPWGTDDKPESRFRKLYQAIIDEIGTTEQNPRLETALDNYLRTLWTLSLSAPVNYIEGHPFDLRKDNELGLYCLQPSAAGQAKPLALKLNEKVRERLGLRAPERGTNELRFRVFVDDIELLRPIRFLNLPETSQAIKTPMVFVGSDAPDLSKINAEERGGDLAFEAYFLWAPKIVPRENNGLLIRISDASGTLFDETFAKYQVSELTRLKQITAEVFILKGLDAALNIDRESFNYAHPHYQYIMRWVHRALRQVMNTLKQAAADARERTIQRTQAVTAQSLEGIVAEEVARASRDADAKPTDVDISESSDAEIGRERKKGRLALRADRIFQPLPEPKRTGKRNRVDRELFRRQIKAVAQVLNAYGLLDDLTYDQQEELLRAIVAIFAVDGGKRP